MHVLADLKATVHPKIKKAHFASSVVLFMNLNCFGVSVGLSAREMSVKEL